MTTILAFRGISKHFKNQRAVDQVSLDIHEGEIFSLLGPSGCGKTTLLRIAAGFLQPDAGSVYLQGEDITQLAPDKRPLNTIFQSYALFPHMDVRDNIAFGPRMAGWSGPQTRSEVERILALVQLEAEAHKKPSALSGGQKQRVALARALILKPRVLLLDEPFAALDLKLRQRMLLELERLQRDVGITFVFVTHDQHEAMSISSRIAVMSAGKIVQLGTPREIYERPQNRFVASFIGDTNLFEGQGMSEAGQDFLSVKGLKRISLPRSSAPFPEKLVMSVRPEKLRLSSARPDACENLFQGIVRDKVYLGSQTRYAVAVEGQLLLVMCAHDHLVAEERVQIGQEVWISWSAHDGYMLPDAHAQECAP